MKKVHIDENRLTIGETEIHLLLKVNEEMVKDFRKFNRKGIVVRRFNELLYTPTDKLPVKKEEIRNLCARCINYSLCPKNVGQGNIEDLYFIAQGFQVLYENIFIVVGCCNFNDECSY